MQNPTENRIKPCAESYGKQGNAMRRIALKIAYDGTGYAGWQRQKNGVSIQQTIEEAVYGLFHETVRLIASGRTDAGVHAAGQIAAMDLSHPIPADRLLMALNSRLPDSIRIMDCREVTANFNPRYDAKRKTYRYLVYEGRVLPPQYRFVAVQETRRMDWGRVREALRLLEGTHDFAAFQTTGRPVGTTVRTIEQAALSASPESPHLYSMDVTGNGFLYNMVRIIAGTALEIGCGKRQMETVTKALATGCRRFAGPTAPAKGLMLMSVEYPGLPLF